MGEPTPICLVCKRPFYFGAAGRHRHPVRDGATGENLGYIVVAGDGSISFAPPTAELYRGKKHRRDDGQQQQEAEHQEREERVEKRHAATPAGAKPGTITFAAGALAPFGLIT